MLIVNQMQSQNNSYHKSRKLHIIPENDFDFDHDDSYEFSIIFMQKFEMRKMQIGITLN